MYSLFNCLIFIFGIFFGEIAFARPASPFSRGVNLTNWFQSGIEYLPFGKYDRSDFENIKSLGADVIRLPVDLKAMLRQDYSPDPRFLFFLDKAVAWADSVGISLILDNHTFDPAVNTTPAVETWLVPVWENLALRYKDRFPDLYFEILNEPHGISDADWNAIQLRTVAAIRAIDSNRWLVIGGAGWNGFNNLDAMPDYPFEKLIYTFHFYEPFLFTHQGATWADPSLLNLKNVPFPFDSGAIPAVPRDLIGTWVAGALLDYANAATSAQVKSLLEIPFEFAKKRNVPVFCGEFGVYDVNAPAADRKHWYKVVRTALEEKNIAWTSWDYHGGFGVFLKPYPAGFFSDLNVDLVDSLGFVAPPQAPVPSGPLEFSLPVFSDFIHKNITSGAWVSGGFSSFVFPKNEQNQDFVMVIARAPQYSSIQITFNPALDLSWFRSGASSLDFELRGTSGISKIDVRFLDTDTGTGDHPWRSRVVLEASETVFDGSWRQVSLPVSRFAEAGAWENGWFEPQNQFEWKAVERLEFVAEHHALTNDSLFLDNVSLKFVPPTGIRRTEQPVAFQLSVYPNPFNPTATIRIGSAFSGKMTVWIADISGRRVKTLFSGVKPSGELALLWDAKDAASGIYIVVAQSEGKMISHKLVLAK